MFIGQHALWTRELPANDRDGSWHSAPTGAGAAGEGDKENTLTDLPINLKTLIETVDARLTFWLLYYMAPKWAWVALLVWH